MLAVLRITYFTREAWIFGRINREKYTFLTKLKKKKTTLYTKL